MPSTVEQIAPSSNVYLNAIQWGGWRWTDGSTPGTSLTYNFGPSGENLNADWGPPNDYGTSQTWTTAEKSAYRAALQTWSNVANLTFTEVN